MGDKIKVTITGKDMKGMPYQMVHILDDFRNIILPIHKRMDMESVRVEKIPDPDPDLY